LATFHAISPIIHDRLKAVSTIDTFKDRIYLVL
jgi:hypothetical protein